MFVGSTLRIPDFSSSSPFAAHWGEGTTSSSDGQRFRAGGRGEASGQINARYGGEPGVLFYTHLSDQYAPFHTQVINGKERAGQSRVLQPFGRNARSQLREPALSFSFSIFEHCRTPKAGCTDDRARSSTRGVAP